MSAVTDFRAARRRRPSHLPTVLAAAAVIMLAGLVANGVMAPRSLAGGSPPPAKLGSMALGHGPTLVFVPDLGLGRTVWMPTARKLLAGHRIVLVDLPGHGDSAMPDPFTFAACAEALDQVLAGEVGDSTVVIGQGVGGVIAALATRSHPEHVRGLVLIDAGMTTPMKIEDQQRQMFLKWMDDNFDAFRTQMYSKRGRDSTQTAELIAQASLVPPATFKLYVRELLSLDETAAMKGFPRPVLYVGSDRGWAAGKTWAEIRAERGLQSLARVDTLRIGGSAALIMKDQPDSLAAAIATFAAKAMAAK
jgi:pimeloyl-ACP methyl ester carboxylesterase